MLNKSSQVGGKIRSAIKPFGIGFLLIAALTSTLAQETSVSDCDKLAAHPDDNNKIEGATGVNWDALDPEKALPACKVAFEKSPGVQRLQFQYARALNKARRYEDARGLYLQLAEDGYVQAQYNLALMYEDGEWVEKNDEQAVKWYRKAAEQGHEVAQNNLGWMYMFGRGVEQSDEEAVEWYRKAASKGYARAQTNLGWMYEFGQGGLPQSYPEAAAWYQSVADQDYAVAQFFLGRLHESGLGAHLNFVQAYKWYSLAAVQGDEDAAEKLSTLSKLMTAQQKAEAQKLVDEWTPKTE